jgi:hypothetical protein
MQPGSGTSEGKGAGSAVPVLYLETAMIWSRSLGVTAPSIRYNREFRNRSWERL